MANSNITFEDVVATVAAQYPKKKIEICTGCGDRLVKINGEVKFNASGFNLLYNMKRLVKCLEEELA